MKILCIVAHPDDEILWCWPVLQRRPIRGMEAMADELTQADLQVACMSLNDHAQCAVAFQQLAAAQRWTPKYYEESCQFYRLPFRGAEDILRTRVEGIRQLIKLNIAQHRPDVIFTHNPVGEYGHGDHRLLAELVYTTDFDGEIWITDICIKNKCHTSYEQMPGWLRKTFYSNMLGVADLDQHWFSRCRDVYIQHQAWSWSGEIATQCGVYRVSR